MNRRTKSPIAIVALLVAATLIFTQAARAASYRWNVTSGNWSTPANWTPPTPLNGPQTTDTVSFCTTGDTTTSTNIVNNTVDQNFTINSLSYTNASTGVSNNVTAIGTGITLTVTNSLKVGQQTGSGAYDTYTYLTGGGTLLVTGTYVDIWQSATVSGPIAYLNLSALTNFVFNPAGGTGGGILGIDDNSSLTREGGSLTLANGSNYINAFLNLGTATSAQAGAGGTLALGPGTNIIYAGGVSIGECKSSFTMQANGGGLLMTGSSGGSSQTPITIGDNAGGGGSQGVTGQLLLNGCAVNIVASTIILGEQPAGGTTLSVAGVFDFDTGTVSATGIIMADNTGGSGTSGSCTGTLQIGPGGTLNVGSGGISLATRTTGSIATTGTLTISNGIVNCRGPINGGTNGAVTAINFLGGGTLSMGGLVGAVAPVGILNVATNTTLAFSVPSYSQTNVVAGTVNWPSPDTGVTIAITALPAGISPGVVFPLITSTNFAGTVVSPVLSLPPGVQGNWSQVTSGTTNTIFVTISAGVGPGVGGVQQLLNPDFALTPLGTDWTTVGGVSVVSTNSTYPNTSGCDPDTRNIVPLVGTNVAKLTGSFIAGGSTNTWSQSVAMPAGSTLTAGAYTYVAHEDMMSGADSFYYEVDFLGTTGNLIAAYESSIVTNLQCGEMTPFALDTWNLMAATNQMQVTGGVNTGVILGNVASVIQTPPQSVTALFKAVFIQRNGTDTGSIYFSGANLGLLSNPVAPTLSAVTPNLVTLSTNTTLTCAVSSSETTISSVMLTAATTTLGGVVTNTISLTNNQGALAVTGLSTPTANINLALTTNTIYQSVTIKAIDADGLTVSSSTISFDTLVPALVIEGSDFNFTSNGIGSGLFFDTPANGGLALYTNQVGMQGIDENKITRTNFQSYYRPLDATVIQAANPVAPSGTEQKFVTAAANGDIRDIEVSIAFDTSGDWQDYSRTFGTSGTYSAQPGTYNVWCYLATSGSGPQVGFFQVTNSPAATGQGTNALGTFGGTTFSDNNFGKFVYAPLVDQFGNRVALTIPSGVQTFRGVIANSDTPNVGFYMLVPVAPIFTPVLLNVYPNGPYDSAGQFTFTVGPEQGTPIPTNGIGLIVNGTPITSGLGFTSIGNGEWTVNYAIQSNEMYSVVINVTNMSGQTVTYSNSFDTFSANNFHWMAVDYDFSTNNGTSSGGSAGNGWTGGLFINNPVPTGDTNAPTDANWQITTNSYLAYPTAFVPPVDTLAGLGAVAQQSIDIFWLTNSTQDTGGLTSNSIYRAASVVIQGDQINSGDGVGTQVATDPLTSGALSEFIFARTNLFSGPFGSGGPDGNICEFNVGYFYTNDWLNYTRTFPTGTFNIWGRLAAGAGAFNGCTLSMVTNGVGTSNQMTQVLGTFSDPNPAGWQAYHWIQLDDTNGNPVYVQFNGQATLKLSAPTNATPSGGSLNPLLFMLAPASAPISPFNISGLVVSGNIRISIPTQIGHSYTLWSSSSLSPASWTQIGSAITGDGTVHVVSQAVTGRQAYFEVLGQ